jgi:glucose repression mediator protein
MTQNAQAMECYQNALRHNRNSIEALRAVASILRAEDKYEQAVEFIRNILALNPADGESWSSLGMLALYDLTIPTS